MKGHDMTVKVCDHIFRKKTKASPQKTYFLYEVDHPESDRQKEIPSHEVYTVEEVNQLLSELRAELMKKIAAVKG